MLDDEPMLAEAQVEAEDAPHLLGLHPVHSGSDFHLLSAKISRMAETAEERRKRRANAEVRVLRPGHDEAANAKYDAAYWLRIPVDKRAEFVWELSVEAFSLPPVR